MGESDPLTAIVTLKKPRVEGETAVTVGVAISLGASPKPPHIPHKDNCLLQAGKNQSDQSVLLHELRNRANGLSLSEEIYIKSGLAAVAGVEYVRSRYSSNFDYQITVLEGQNLVGDYTIGFCIAASKATARAIGVVVPPTEGSDEWPET